MTTTAGRRAFERDLVLAGWAPWSRWGYDDVLECYWARLWRPARPASEEPDAVIGPEHLVGTVSGLARAVAWEAQVTDTEAYLALIA